MFKRILSLIGIICIISTFAFNNKPGAFPRKWCMLQRDSSGYVYYRFLEGTTPYISIKSDKLTLAWQLDDPEIYKISSLTQLKSDDYLIRCKGSYCNMLLYVRWIDKMHTMALWKFKRTFKKKALPDDELKWVMCPVDRVTRFKYVTIKGNDSVKIPEKQFLPIVIN